MSALSVILTPFAKLILLFYSITGSYGVSLLLFALVIRLILFPVFFEGAEEHALHERPGGKTAGTGQKIRQKPREVQPRAGKTL